MNIQLETDRRNTAETHAFYLTRAVAVFADRLERGVEVNAANAEACAYLRRKTGWCAPVAQGALDSAIRDQYNAE